MSKSTGLASEIDYELIHYKIEAAYASADSCPPDSDWWHYWMDEAKALENMVRGR